MSILVHICIKYIFMTLCSSYFFVKLLHLPTDKKAVAALITAAVGIGTVTGIARQFATFACIFLMVAMAVVVHQWLFKNALYTTITTTTIAFGCSYVAFLVATVVSTPVTFLLPYALFGKDMIGTEWNDYLCDAAVGVLQPLLAFLLFRIRRLKNGMPFLQRQQVGELGALISMIILLFSALMLTENNSSDQLIALALFVVTIGGVFLYSWWRRHITSGYQEKLREQEQDALRKTIAEQQQELDRLLQNNDAMAQVLHKDNKLIPAMELAVRELLACSTISDEERENAERLLQRLENMSSERSGMVKQYEADSKTLPQTGVAAIDSLTTYFLARSREEQVEFDAAFSASVPFLAEHILAEEPLATITADLLENALIAVRGQHQRHILLQIGIEEQHYVLSVLDSGIPFQPVTLLNAGKQKATTHADTGGSGIGLMSLFEIAASCRASIEIDEQVALGGFTKKVSVRFDNEGAYRLRTDRPEVITTCAARADLQLFPVLKKPAEA